MVQMSSMISMASVFAISRICNHFGVPFYATMMCQLAAVIILTRYFNSTGGGGGKSIVGEPAPSLEGLRYLQGAPIKVGQGRVIVVEFWATWCPPCKSSIPHLDKAYKNFNPKGVDFVGITKEGASVVLPFISKMANTFTYPVAQDENGSVQSGFPVNGIPAAFVIGKDGLVAWEGHPMAGLEAAIEAALNPGEASGSKKED